MSSTLAFSRVTTSTFGHGGQNPIWTVGSLFANHKVHCEQETNNWAVGTHDRPRLSPREYHDRPSQSHRRVPLRGVRAEGNEKEFKRGMVKMGSKIHLKESTRKIRLYSAERLRPSLGAVSSPPEQSHNCSSRWKEQNGMQPRRR